MSRSLNKIACARWEVANSMVALIKPIITISTITILSSKQMRDSCKGQQWVGLAHGLGGLGWAEGESLCPWFNPWKISIGPLANWVDESSLMGF